MISSNSLLVDTLGVYGREFREYVFFHDYSIVVVQGKMPYQ